MAPSERIAYRCSFCGIIFDSISHRYFILLYPQTVDSKSHRYFILPYLQTDIPQDLYPPIPLDSISHRYFILLYSQTVDSKSHRYLISFHTPRLISRRNFFLLYPQTVYPIGILSSYTPKQYITQVLYTSLPLDRRH